MPREAVCAQSPIRASAIGMPAPPLPKLRKKVTIRAQARGDRGQSG
jgi:hypothetical protein